MCRQECRRYKWNEDSAESHFDVGLLEDLENFIESVLKIGGVGEINGKAIVAI